MIIVALILMFVFGVSIGGYLQKRLTEKLFRLENEKLNLSKKNDFLEVMFKIRTGESKFKTRVNDTVYISLNLADYGDVDLIYLIDKQDIAIFQETKCLHTSDGITKDIIGEMVALIFKIYGKKINDTVEILGFVFYREEFERSFNVKFDELKNSNLFNNVKVDMNEIEKINIDNQKRYDIDEILDKISMFGIKVLTPEELEFLDKYSNEKRD